MATTTTNRHPIRGFLYGIVLGLGLMLVVVGQGIAALGTWPPFLVLVLGIVVGTLWSTMGPAKAPKGPPPADATPIATESPTQPSDPGEPAAPTETPEDVAADVSDEPRVDEGA